MRTSTAELFQAVSAPSDGVSLAALLESSKGEQLGLTMALDLGAAIAERVGAIHASGRVLGQFDAGRVTCTRDGRVLLSREPSAALAPELRRGEPPSIAADVYAVGYLVYQLLTGRTPAQASAAEQVSRLREVPAPSRFNAKVDAELDTVVLLALRHEPSERPASVMVLQSALDGISEELQLAPEPEEIGRWVAKLLEAPKAKPSEPEPLPVPRPSPSAAVATSKLQAPLFPGRAPTPEALTTSKFEPWLPPPEPSPMGEGARRADEGAAELHPVTPVTPVTPVVTAPFVPAAPEPTLKETVPMRSIRATSSQPTAPAGARALSLAASVTMLDAPAAPKHESVPTLIEPKPVVTMVDTRREPVPPSLLETIPVQAVKPQTATVAERPRNSHAQVVAAAVTMVEPVAPHAHDTVADAWLKSPGAHRFIDQDYEQTSSAHETMSPGAIGGASVAGVVLLIALLLAIASPPAPVAAVQDEPAPVRASTRTVRAASAVEKAAPVVAQPIAKAAPVAKKKVVRRRR